MTQKSLIDINSLINSKNKSSKNWYEHNFLFNKISELLGEKLKELGCNYDKILLLSSDAGESLENTIKVSFSKLIFLSPYRNLLNKKNNKSNKILKVESHFENLPLKNEKFDLIISNLCINSIIDKKKHLNVIYQLLKVNGLLVCNFFGERTMYELRDSLFSTDEKLFNGAFMRLPINLKMVEISDLLGQVGFDELVSETISYKIYYKNIRKIFEDLKGIGENKILSDRKKSLMTNNYLNTLNNEYKKKFSDENGLRLSCDVVSVSCWKNKII